MIGGKGGAGVGAMFEAGRGGRDGWGTVGRGEAVDRPKHYFAFSVGPGND